MATTEDKGSAKEKVNHPAHYGGADNPYEAIKVIEAWELDFCLGNTVKYIARAGKKEKSTEIEDLNKAALNTETWECPYDKDWLLMIDQAEYFYKKLLSKGWRPQEARSVFPNALASRIVTSANLRQWRHFFIMRTTQEAHPQIKQVTIPLLNEFKLVFPLLYDDIEPNQKQAQNLRLPR